MVAMATIKYQMMTKDQKIILRSNDDNGQKRSKDDPEILFGSKASQPQLSKLDPAQ